MRLDRQGSSLVVRTPAKLNLFLDVLGKRPDGYHELETLMVSIGLFDTLRFETNDSGGLELSLDPASPGIPREILPLLPLDGQNLILKAAQLLREFTGCQKGVRIHLSKAIPLQAGLGGGSSDAAAALVGLNEFWKLGLKSQELHPLAARLGSDVNFFLDSAPLAMCRGRGEQIEPMKLGRPLHFVLVKPPGGLSTREVFSRLKIDRPHGSDSICQAIRSGNVCAMGAQLHNSLEVPAGEFSAEVASTLAALDQVTSVGRLMTGSGSSCFALCAHRGQAVRAAQQLRSLMSESRSSNSCGVIAGDPADPARNRAGNGSRYQGQVFVVQTAT